VSTRNHHQHQQQHSAAVCEMDVRFSSASCACLVCRFLLNFSLPSSLFLLSYRRHEKKKITGDELNAHAEADSYQRGAHREEASCRDYNKHMEEMKLDQNAALNRDIL
jgi:hypothetical protein